ncbi:transglycosylase domain-containing protein [Alkalilacustris brevis]|uniref:transglycosylase domain-containing protein n=1 Tax=Alkalilacustris brevis TaxID=2026338 RepID=UPI000E0D8B34|nr:PBP1A family penicillin-binding protein [Alkalilacustris brevis]
MAPDRKNRPPLTAQRRPARQKATPPRRKAAAGSGKRGQRRGGPVRRALGGLLRLVTRLVWGLTWRVGAGVAVLLGAATFYFYSTLPPMSELLDGRARGSVTMLDHEGRVYAWRGETFGGQITAENISPHLRNAIIATEDRRFYQHFGISPRGIASAVRINLSQGRGPFSGHGGSTITQQVAKLLCLGVPFDPSQWESEAAYERECRRSTVWRKIQEVPFALAMEIKYPKDDILSIYLNRAYLGAGARGFEAAAQRYFGKSANQVDPAEAAMLAGLLVAPSYFAPTRNLSRAQDRANVILGLMADQGQLSGTELAVARASPARLSAAAEARAGGYFADWVMETGPSFLTRQTTEDVIIRTTYDQRIQSAAEEALAHVFETRVREGSEAQAAIVVMSADGAVRAMVGGRNTQVSGAFNRATQALRQTGSAFKPFVYAVAMDMGYEPTDIVEDAPLTLDIPGSGPWSPRNYTGEFQGMVTLTEAFAQSLNIPAVRISEALGRDNVRTVANLFGVRSSLADGPALALGASESTLLEMTAAYAGILNGGSSVSPYGLEELTLAGDGEPLMGKGGGIGKRVIRQEAARKLTWMMHEVVESGTGRRARIEGRELAGKTGTTQAARDAWFIGFSADYVAGVWMGYDDNTPLTGVTGSSLPAEIWRETMKRAHEGLPASPLPMDPPHTPPAEYEPYQPPGSWTAQPPEAEESLGERILRDVLGGLLR